MCPLPPALHPPHTHTCPPPSPSSRTSWKLVEVTRQQDGCYSLLYDTPEGRLEVISRSVGLTVPAYVAAGLLSTAAVRVEAEGEGAASR